MILDLKKCVSCLSLSHLSCAHIHFTIVLNHNVNLNCGCYVFFFEKHTDWHRNMIMAGEFVIDTPQKLKRKLEMVILFFPVILLTWLSWFLLEYDCPFLSFWLEDTLMRILLLYTFVYDSVCFHVSLGSFLFVPQRQLPPIFCSFSRKEM